MTGRELIEKIQELKAEDKEIMFQPKPGHAYEDIRIVEITCIGWFHEIVGIRSR